jgi:nucleoid-associated protein
MIVQIRNLIVHRIVKDRYHESVLKCRDEVLEPTDLARSVVEEMRDVYYKKSGKAFGAFEPDEITYPFGGELKAYLAGSDFVAFTKAAMRLLKSKIDARTLATGGNVFFAHYEQEGKVHMLMAMVNDRTGAVVDAETLELAGAVHLDLHQLAMGAHIDIDSLLDNPAGPCVSYIKGRGKREVSAYFREFVGCVEYTDARDHTDTLVQAVYDFGQQRGMSDSTAGQMRQDVHRYCIEKYRAGHEVFVDELSRVIDPADPEAFLEFAQQPQYRITNGFAVDHTSIQRLQKFTWRDKGVAVTFDLALLNRRVMFNSERNELLIREVPDEIAKQLREIQR